MEKGGAGRKVEALLKQKEQDPKALLRRGAEGGTRTLMVSRTILSRVRLPFRHFGK